MGKIEINNISKKYGQKYALKNVSLTFEAGKVYGLIGKNGAGKTTVMKILCGIINQDQGEVDLNNNVVGALIEEPAAYKNMNAKENLEVFVSNFKKPDLAEILRIMNQVGLQNNNQKVKEYSLGMRKRLGIAMALINNPSVLILDEPTAGLDINGINDTRKIIKEYIVNKNNIALISSHDTRDIVELCDCIIFIDQGKIVKKLDEFERDPIALEKEYLLAVGGSYVC